MADARAIMTVDLRAPALSRIEFDDVSTPTPLHYLIERALAMSESVADERCGLLTFTGRPRRLAAEKHHAERKTVLEERGGVGSEVRLTIGTGRSGCTRGGGRGCVGCRAMSGQQDRDQVEL